MTSGRPMPVASDRGEVFVSMREAERAMGVGKNGLRSAMLSGRATCCGRRWRLIPPDEARELGLDEVWRDERRLAHSVPWKRNRVPDGMKRCCHCGRVLPESEFSRCRTCRDGLDRRCKACRRERYVRERTAAGHAVGRPVSEWHARPTMDHPWRKGV